MVVDCCNGAGCGVSDEFLRQLGCEVVAINNTPDGVFPHNPEPVPANLCQLAEAVREHEADIGFAQDADADRLCLASEKGVAISEEFTLAFVCDALPKQMGGPVVANLSTSRMVEEAAGRNERKPYRSPVGEINVVEEMMRRDAAIGGEGNGGVIWPRLQYCRDSFVGMALILRGLAERGDTVSKWQASFRPSVMIKERVECPASSVQPVLMALREYYGDENVDLTEGVRVVWEDESWLHARPSNTEPIIRIVAEADEGEDGMEKCRRAMEVVEAHGGSRG